MAFIFIELNDAWYKVILPYEEILLLVLLASTRSHFRRDG